MFHLGGALKNRYVFHLGGTLKNRDLIGGRLAYHLAGQRQAQADESCASAFLLLIFIFPFVLFLQGNQHDRMQRSAFLSISVVLFLQRNQYDRVQPAWRAARIKDGVLLRNAEHSWLLVSERAFQGNGREINSIACRL